MLETFHIYFNKFVYNMPSFLIFNSHHPDLKKFVRNTETKPNLFKKKNLLLKAITIHYRKIN